jgi:YVTN family beta-propeller protein
MVTRTLSRLALLAIGLVMLALFMGGTAWAKGYVYITLNEGFLYCFDASNYSMVFSGHVDNQDFMGVSDDGRWLYLAGPEWIDYYNTSLAFHNQTGDSITYDIVHSHLNIADIAMGDDRVYLADVQGVEAYDVNTKERVGVAVTRNPYRIELSPDHDRLYVANCLWHGNYGAYYWSDYNITVYDADTFGLIRSRHFDMTIEGLAVSPDGNSLYVIGHNSSTGSKKVKMLKLRASDLATQRTAYGEGYLPFDIVVSPDGSKVYVSEYDNDTIRVLNADTLALERSVAAGDRPMFMDISPDGKKLYFTGRNGEFRVLDTDTFALFTTICRRDCYSNSIKYVNVGPSFMQYYLFNFSLATPTPGPTIMMPIFNVTMGSATPAPPSSTPSASPPASATAEAPVPSASAVASSPAESSPSPPPEATPGISEEASASPAPVSTPGFSGLFAAVILSAGALLSSRRNKS